MELSLPAEGSNNGNRRRFRVVRFGAFEFRADAGELRKHGIRIRVQSKPLQALRLLLEHAGELVSREALCHELWGEGVFVDFESGLNTAMNRLRAALGDSAGSPRYIETVPRRGYRFICPIIVVAGEESRNIPSIEPKPNPAVAHTIPGSSNTRPHERFLRRAASLPKRYWYSTILLLLGVVTAAILLSHSKAAGAASQALSPPHATASGSGAQDEGSSSVNRYVYTFK